MIALLLLACAEPEPLPDEGPAPERPPLPDLSHIDLPAAFSEMLAMGLTVDMRAPWAAHREALALGEPGCPDLYLGAPEADMGPEGGVSWADRCLTRAGLSFAGDAWWEGLVDARQDEVEGRVVDARRALEGDGVVARGDEVLFEFDGEGADSLQLVEDGDYLTWGTASTLRATVTGSLPFGDGALAGGWRADMSLDARGGATERLTARGEVFFFEARVQGHFDSMQVDLELVGEGSAGPEDCAAEPKGWIGLRDADAIWYDLVFMPRYDDPDEDPYPNDPHSACDGCGTLYVRGEVWPEPVCVDLDPLRAALVPPDPADFLITVRDPSPEAR